KGCLKLVVIDFLDAHIHHDRAPGGLAGSGFRPSPKLITQMRVSCYAGKRKGAAATLDMQYLY
ncbi:MAG: hypothetical protein IIT59_00870, partial [Rhodocyclaceae bacterium]|nr:hypothetical protein [Rhodocyclaceae bacterium]